MDMAGELVFDDLISLDTEGYLTMVQLAVHDHDRPSTRSSTSPGKPSSCTFLSLDGLLTRPRVLSLKWVRAALSFLVSSLC